MHKEIENVFTLNGTRHHLDATFILKFAAACIFNLLKKRIQALVSWNVHQTRPDYNHIGGEDAVATSSSSPATVAIDFHAERRRFPDHPAVKTGAS